MEKIKRARRAARPDRSGLAPVDHRKHIGLLLGLLQIKRARRAARPDIFGLAPVYLRKHLGLFGWFIA